MKNEIDYAAEARVVRDEIEEWSIMYRQCDTRAAKAYAWDMINLLNKIAKRLENHYEG